MLASNWEFRLKRVVYLKPREESNECSKLFNLDSLELRLAGVTSIEQANEFSKAYIKEFNAQFALPVNNTKLRL